MVVRTMACCGDGKVGYVGRVVSIDPRPILQTCPNCGTPFKTVDVEWHDGKYTEISRVRRIPPLSELDDVRQDEEITA